MNAFAARQDRGLGQAINVVYQAGKRPGKTVYFAPLEEPLSRLLAFPVVVV
jgi:hypothetical protein